MHIICLFVASIKDVGKKFQLANVKDVNYRTEETPSESENVNNNHAYEYDANGNLVYVNTSRTKKDGVSDEKTTERKLKWDEENRLLASDDNGFVTNYHPDHLGSSSYITNLDGEVVQHIEYVPFGEVFVEERNNISNNPLRRERNGKR